MSVSPELRQVVYDRINECLGKASRHFGRVYNSPGVEFTCRGQVAGYCQGILLNFNPILLNENTYDFIENTVPHEVAHYVDRVNGTQTRTWSGKRSVHGPSWKAIMRVFGCDPKRTHNYDTSRAQVRVKSKFEYRCQGCGHTMFLGPVRHRRIQSGQRYWHPPCGQTRGQLEFVQAKGQQTYRQLRAAQAPAPTKEVPCRGDHLSPRQSPVEVLARLRL